MNYDYIVSECVLDTVSGIETCEYGGAFLEFFSFFLILSVSFFLIIFFSKLVKSFFL